jgi:hypothetical protein
LIKYKREQRIGRAKEKRQCVENPRGKTIEKEIRGRNRFYRKLVLLILMNMAQKAGFGIGTLGSPYVTQNNGTGSGTDTESKY